MTRSPSSVSPRRLCSSPAHPVNVVLFGIVMALSSCSSPNTTAPGSQPGPSASSEQARVPDKQLARIGAVQLSQNRYADATKSFEELLTRLPNDETVMVQLMRCYSGLADTAPNPNEAKIHRRKARELAEKLEKVGTTSPLPPLIIASTAPDGSTKELPKGYFSDRSKVDALMRQGEAAFGRHDFGKALDFYTKAAEADPSNYLAALYAGDALFAHNKPEEACDWFRKAIALKPDTETAHRYLGDALGRLGRNEEAYREWIAAAICDPYRRETRQHFTAAMRAAAEANGRGVPRLPPMGSKIKGDQITLAVDPDDGIAIMVYNIAAMGWRKGEFAKQYPQEKKLRRSLPEEVVALSAMLELAEDSQHKADLQKWETAIAGLLKLQQDGLLEAYALLERADEELVKDYAAFRADHREQLERYIRLYWCGF